jgi:hypothetical protein
MGSASMSTRIVRQVTVTAIAVLAITMHRQNAALQVSQRLISRVVSRTQIARCASSFLILTR